MMNRRRHRGSLVVLVELIISRDRRVQELDLQEVNIVVRL